MSALAESATVNVEPYTLEKIRFCAPPVVAFADMVTVVPLMAVIFVPDGMPVPWMVAPTAKEALLDTTIVAWPLVSVQLRAVPVITAENAIRYPL